MTKVFIKKQWGFGAKEWPVIAFPKEDRCQSLINRAKGEPDALVAIIGTTGRSTHEDDRGRLLGMATFERSIIPSESLISKDQRSLERHYADDENKKFKWPFGVEIEKAYCFPEKPYAEEIIDRDIGGQIASGMAVLLNDEDAEAILALERELIFVNSKVNNVGDSPIENVEDKKDTHTKGPTRGPVPSSRSGSVSYERNAEGLAYVYALRFGNSDIWKIGWAKNVAKRLDDVNKHVPHEILKQEWQEYFFEEYDNQQSAYATEQALLKLLKDKRTHGERVQCSEEDIKNAWDKINGSC